MSLIRLWVVLVVLLTLSQPGRAAPEIFAEAQEAAQEGRYNDVVSLLSSAIMESALAREIGRAHV